MNSCKHCPQRAILPASVQCLRGLPAHSFVKNFLCTIPSSCLSSLGAPTIGHSICIKRFQRALHPHFYAHCASLPLLGADQFCQEIAKCKAACVQCENRCKQFHAGLLHRSSILSKHTSAYQDLQITASLLQASFVIVSEHITYKI